MHTLYYMQYIHTQLAGVLRSPAGHPAMHKTHIDDHKNADETLKTQINSLQTHIKHR